MGFLDKLKNVFFEEEEVEEEVENTAKLARKIEVPKKKTPPLVEEVKKEIVEEPKIEINEPIEEEVVVKEEVKIQEEVVETPVPNKFAMMFEEEDFVLEEPVKPVMTRGERAERAERLERKNLYPEKKEETYSESIKKDNSYGYTKTYYESRETKTFTPSPIISPIYGILDKNYKKEEVVTKKEIRISSASRGKVDLDTVRNKAFGDTSDEILDNKPVEPVKIKEKEKEVSIYDVNNNKPSVKGVTLEAADEYYRDLGLAYNVDYSDKSKDNTMSRVEKEKENRLEDNLFDLIESMYDKED